MDTAPTFADEAPVAGQRPFRTRCIEPRTGRLLELTITGRGPVIAGVLAKTGAPMRGTLVAALISALFPLSGCHGRPPDTADRLPDLATLEMVVEADEEHLGHNINESGGHSVWCDGLRARLLPSDEPLMIYSINNPFNKSAHRFEKRRRYEVRFYGELGTGIMAYEGKCLDLAQISEVREIDRSANR